MLTSEQRRFYEHDESDSLRHDARAYARVAAHALCKIGGGPAGFAAEPPL